MYKKGLSLVIIWWACISFSSINDMTTGMSTMPQFMTSDQISQAKVVTQVVPTYAYDLVFQSYRYMGSGPAAQEAYIVNNIIHPQTGVDAEPCAEY